MFITLAVKYLSKLNIILLVYFLIFEVNLEYTLHSL